MGAPNGFGLYAKTRIPRLWLGTVLRNELGHRATQIDPIIAGVLKCLPKSGAAWPEAERKLWLQLREGSFRLIDKDGPNPPLGERMLSEAREKYGNKNEARQLRRPLQSSLGWLCGAW